MSSPPSAPRVSVLMTLYNKGPFVEEAVQSVLSQSFSDFELLVVDDASTDDGPQRVRAMNDPRIRLLHHEANRGRAGAANSGYEAARGTYIAVLDADDTMHPERLAKQTAFLDAHPEVGALGSWAESFGAREQLIKMPATDSEARGQMLMAMPVIYGVCMLRRSVLEEHGIRCDPDWLLPGMDRLFILKIARHAKYANLQDVLTYYRLGEQNMRHGRDGVKDMQELYREVFKRFGIPATDGEARLQTGLHHDIGCPPPSLREVWATGRWVKRFKRLNAELGICPEAEFNRELDRRWDALFYRTAEHRACASLMHLFLTGKVRERFGDWLKLTKDRVLRLFRPRRVRFT